MDKQQQDYLKIMDFINQHPIAVLGTLDEAGMPYGAAIYVATGGEEATVYFITKNGTAKFKNLMQQRVASLTIVDPATMTTVQSQGHIALLTDAAVADRIHRQISAAHNPSVDWLPPIAQIKAGQYEIIALRLTRARLSNYGDRNVSPIEFVAATES